MEGLTRHSAGGWSWMEDVTNIQTKAGTTLNGAITTATTTVTVTSGTDFDSSGRFWVKTSSGAIDFVDYTGKSTNDLTGATDIDIDHASGENVEKLYATPSDFAKVISMISDRSELFYWNAYSSNQLPPPSTFFTRGAYWLFSEGIGATDITIWYQKKAADLSTGVTATDDAKSMDIPEEFYRYAVEQMKSYIFRIRRQNEEANESLQLAEDELQRALDYDTSHSTSTRLLTW